MKRRAFALFAGLLLLGLMPGSALALPTAPPANLDLSNGPIDDSDANDNVIALAQTFTADKSGSLTAVDLFMSSDLPVTVTVSLEATTDAKPNGTVLATSSGAPSETNAWVHFSFLTPPTVTSGTMYAIVFNKPGVSRVFMAAVYSGGHAWDADGGGVWYSLVVGGSGQFAFQTWLGAPAAAATPSPTAAPTTAPTAAPTAAPTPTPTPFQSLQGETAVPVRTATPPPTSTGDGSSSAGDGSAIWLVLVALFACFGGLFVSRRYRRVS